MTKLAWSLLLSLSAIAVGVGLLYRQPVLGADEPPFDDTRCFKCKGPFHPATGHYFRPDVAYCGRCAIEWARWYKARMAPRVGKKGPPHARKKQAEFYEEAVTSIRPPR